MVVMVDKLTVVEGMVVTNVAVYVVNCPERAVVSVERLRVVEGIVDEIVVV